MATLPSDGDPGTFDVAVIGAGPAGLAAAAAAAGAGCRVAIIDAGARQGGQYWRHRAAAPDHGQHDAAAFRRLRMAIERHGESGRLVALFSHQVWHVERRTDDIAVHVAAGDRGLEILARTVVVASGAHDRQLPFPGWTLPGVMTAGAAQALLKGHGVIAGRRIVVAGTGPFLLPVAAGLAGAGARVVGVFEAGRPTAFARYPAAVLGNLGKLVEGAGYLSSLVRHRVPYRTRTAVVAALGGDAVTGVRVAGVDGDWRIRPGTERDVACDAVAVGYGFTPQVEIPAVLGCELYLDGDGSLVTRVDADQRTSVPGVYVAGEACGVGGAQLALAEGELAGLRVAEHTVGTVPEPRITARLGRRREAQRRFAAALHAAFPVRPGWQQWLDPSTLVCRCEEVDAERLRAAVSHLGATDARSAKFLTRVGMGLCQGRVCGHAVAAIVASEAGRSVTDGDLRGMAFRPVAQPIPLGLLAGLTHAPQRPR